MARTISKLTLWRFEKQKMDINNLVKFHYNYDEILQMLEKYDVKETVCDTYDDEEDSERCTWQDCNYVGNWASTQKELNESCRLEIEYINKEIVKNNIDANDCLYIYEDGGKIILYFPLRDVCDDYFIALNKKSYVAYQWTNDGTAEMCRYEEKISSGDLECYHCSEKIGAGERYAQLMCIEDGEMYNLHLSCADKSISSCKEK